MQLIYNLHGSCCVVIGWLLSFIRYMHVYISIDFRHDTTKLMNVAMVMKTVIIQVTWWDRFYIFARVVTVFAIYDKLIKLWQQYRRKYCIVIWNPSVIDTVENCKSVMRCVSFVEKILTAVITSVTHAALIDSSLQYTWNNSTVHNCLFSSWSRTSSLWN